MNDSDTQRLKEVISKRKDFVLLVLAAAVLAFGINIFIGYILQTKDIPKEEIIFIGATAIIIVLIGMLLFSFRSRKYSKTINACFLINHKTNRLMPIRDYDFSEDLTHIINSVLTENDTFKNIWDKTPLLGQDTGERKPRLSKKATATLARQDQINLNEKKEAVSLLLESIEYIVLEELSIHLSSYFSSYANEDSFIQEYQGKDMPALLLENRVLAMLNLADREKENKLKDSPATNTVSSDAINSIPDDEVPIYNRFDLILPTGTSISRSRPGKIELEKNHLRFTIDIDYPGSSQSLPIDFIVMFLGVDDPDEVDAKQVNIKITYTVKALSLLFQSGWEYFYWAESFKERLDDIFSVDNYFKRINLDTLSVLFRTFHNREISREKKRAKLTANQ
jgi:hypothetical protein